MTSAVSFRAAADPKGLASRRARERARKGVRELKNDLCDTVARISKDAVSGLDGLIREALAVAATPPQKRKQQTHQPRWTLKRLGKWLESKFGVSGCRETVRKAFRAEPNEIADRLWVTTHLKPKVEKLRVST